MDEVRRAARRSEGQVEDYSGHAARPGSEGADPVTIGIDDRELVQRVMQRLRAMPEPKHPPTAAAVRPIEVPDPVARDLGLDRDRQYGLLHRMLGKVRRWLFRATKIQAEFEKMYERINADLMDVERRSGVGTLELQLWLERRVGDSGGAGGEISALGDPLELSPEQRRRMTAADADRLAAEAVPYAREAARRARTDGNRDVLELGSGQGAVLSALREAGLDAVGVDPNPLRVRKCQEQGLEVIRASLREYLLGCPESEFRCVIALHVVQYVAESEVQTLVGQLKSIIAPGGRLVLEVPAGSSAGGRAPDADWLVRACETAGFSAVFTHALHPPDAVEQFKPVDPDAEGAAQLNGLIEQLNARFCGPRDILIIAENESLAD